SADFDTYCKPLPDRGPCDEFIPAWWFSVSTGQCKRFVYSGCEGNKNNYMSRADCEASCLRRLAENEYEAPCINGACAASLSRLAYPPFDDDDFFRGKLTSQPGTLKDIIRANPILSREAVGLNPVCNETKYPGPCAGYFPRYYFNNVTKTCEKFIYGGCHANGNNFQTFEECQNTCWAYLDQQHALETGAAFEFPFLLGLMLRSHSSAVASPALCTYPADRGPCFARMLRFFYNTLTKTCEQFVYGGCGGNANNFRAFDECEKKCKTVYRIIPRA
ncbi:hypothetical protein MTO96_037642, partial [Rhipicephalus appendiculatus]